MNNKAWEVVQMALVANGGKVTIIGELATIEINPAPNIYGDIPTVTYPRTETIGDILRKVNPNAA